MNPQTAIRELAAHVRSAVLPHMGAWRSRKVTGIASSGDATFSIDDIAEEAVVQFIEQNSLAVAYYSEDRGLISPQGVQKLQGILIIDPIDGTRAAIAGLESCVVSVAWCDAVETPLFSDVHYSAICEIKTGQTLVAERGGKVEIFFAGGTAADVQLSPITEIDQAGISLGTVGAPLELLFQAIGGLVSRTTVRGGFFVLNSSAFELTRLVTGQMSAVLDVRCRLLRDFPNTRNRFIQTGGGRLLSLYGYDVAAAAMIAETAGCVVTDAWGSSLKNWPLMDTSEGNFGSLIAAANPQLHASLLQAVNDEFANFSRFHS